MFIRINTKNKQIRNEFEDCAERESPQNSVMQADCYHHRQKQEQTHAQLTSHIITVLLIYVECTLYILYSLVICCSAMLSKKGNLSQQPSNQQVS